MCFRYMTLVKTGWLIGLVVCAGWLIRWSGNGIACFLQAASESANQLASQLSRKLRAITNYVTGPAISAWEGVGMAPKNPRELLLVAAKFDETLTWHSWGVDLSRVRFL